MAVWGVYFMSTIGMNRVLQAFGGYERDLRSNDNIPGLPKAKKAH